MAATPDTKETTSSNLVTPTMESAGQSRNGWPAFVYLTFGHLPFTAESKAANTTQLRRMPLSQLWIYLTTELFKKADTALYES
jgi:hypothetical protein